MERLCAGCLRGLGELRLCPDCGADGSITVTRVGEIVSFSPEVGFGCQECGDTRREVRFTHFRRVTALIFFDQVHTYAGYFCKACRRRLFFKHQGLTMLLGWWGFLAMLIRNPYAIFSNFMAVWRQPFLPGARNVINIRDLGGRGNERARARQPRQST